MSNELDSIKIYEFVRDEIKREDANTQNRLSIALAFQGILMAATVLLLGEGWFADTIGNPDQNNIFANHLNAVRIVMLFLLGASGVLVAIISNTGVDAAQKSISKTIENWEKAKKKIDKPKGFENLPRAYADEEIHNKGKGFPYFLNRAFMAIWIVFLITAFIGFRADFAGFIL